MKHVYEIYTKCPLTGVTGWEIEFVYASEDEIESFPNFDCIITVDDCPISTMIINWR
jgi:hypothetical protein